MIKSMTAYAEHTTEHEGFSVTAEIKTYNSRYLDVVLRMPSAYRVFENKTKQLIAEWVSRGRVEASITVRDGRECSVPVYNVDKARAVACYEALKTLQVSTGVDGPIPIELIARTEGVITPSEPEPPGPYEWDRVNETICAALMELDTMRKQEGAFIAGDLGASLDLIGEMVDGIESRSVGLASACYERLKSRIETLVHDMNGIDDGRIAQEAAMIADKSDLSEEIVRAKSHIQQFRAALSADEPCGRKLNFLLQEFNREFNTMGGKTGNIDISENVVTAKTELEKLREQVQNVE